MFIRNIALGLLFMCFPSQVFAQSNSETSLDMSGLYISDVTINDDGSVLKIDDVYGAEVGVRSEKVLSQSGSSDLLLALSINGAKGEGEISDGSSGPNLIAGEQADFYRVEGFADLVKRREGEFLSPFLSAGAGVKYERIETNGSKFESLSPAARFRAGFEKDVSEKFSLGVSTGPSVKLD